MEGCTSFSRYIISRHRSKLDYDFQEYLKDNLVTLIDADRYSFCKVSGLQKMVHDICGDGNGVLFRVLFKCFISDGLIRKPISLDRSYFTTFDNEFGSIEKCDWKYNDGMERLNDYLIPNIDDMDLAAESLLAKVYGSENIPEKIDSIDFAKRIGLRVLKGKVKGWPSSVMGAVFFRNVNSILLLERGKLDHIPGATILVNPDVFNERNIGSVNNTIIHECVHYLLHWRVFKFRSITCSSYDGSVLCNTESNVDDDSLTIQIERQATLIAPKILLQRSVFQPRVKELIEDYHERHAYFRSVGKTDEKIDADLISQYVIPSLADEYCVSKLAIKIRMIETGFEIARGVNIYLDDEYLRPYSFSVGSLDPYETFTLSLSAYNQLMVQNESFRECIISGAFRFVENHVVLNHNAVCILDGFREVYYLTDYARAHMDQIALKFHVYRKGSSPSYFGNVMGFMLRLPKDTIKERLSFLPDANINLLKVSKEKREKWIAFYRGLDCYAWNDRLKAIMKEQGYDISSLSVECNMNYYTLQRYLADSEGHQMPKNVFTHICMVLEIPEYISERLIQDSGFLRFDTFNKEDICYLELMHHYYGQRIEFCNEYLVSNGIKPFTNEMPARRNRLLNTADVI